MGTRTEIAIDYTSPYKRTRLFAKAGRVFFGRWQPVLVRLDGDEEEIEVQLGFEGQLDLYAHAFYGDRRLWRVLAQVNKVDFPVRDITVGRRLIIPKPHHVAAAMLATTSLSTSTELGV